MSDRYCRDLRTTEILTASALVCVLEEAKSGVESSEKKLFVWLYRTALEYFLSKVTLERTLTTEDAQDLACDTILEFSRSWRTVQSPIHYVRRMMRNNLSRFLRKKRIRSQRTGTLDFSELDRLSAVHTHRNPEPGFEQVDDEDRRRHLLIASELERADDLIRSIVHYRILAGHLTYSEIARILEASETSLRMRMTRFKHRVQSRHRQLVLREEREAVLHGAGRGMAA